MTVQFVAFLSAYTVTIEVQKKGEQRCCRIEVERQLEWLSLVIGQLDLLPWILGRLKASAI
jgi:hypothetical protein